MHVEPPDRPLISLKEFGIHYLMIVVSILTAIGLEEVLRAHHNAESARAAEDSIERELKSNLADLREAIKGNRERLAELKGLGDQIAEMIRQGAGNPAVTQKKVADEFLPKLSVGLVLPGPSREAWDVAVASQAAGHIPRDKLEVYTSGYTVEREALVGAHSGMMVLDGPRMIDLRADAEIGPVEPRRILELARESAAMNATGLSNLVEAEKEMTRTLGKIGLHVE